MNEEISKIRSIIYDYGKHNNINLLYEDITNLDEYWLSKSLGQLMNIRKSMKYFNDKNYIRYDIEFYDKLIYFTRQILRRRKIKKLINV